MSEKKYLRMFEIRAWKKMEDIFFVFLGSKFTMEISRFVSKHLNSHCGKFQNCGTSPSSFLAKKANDFHIFYLEIYLWQNIGTEPKINVYFYLFDSS